MPLKFIGGPSEQKNSHLLIAYDFEASILVYNNWFQIVVGIILFCCLVN